MNGNPNEQSLPTWTAEANALLQKYCAAFGQSIGQTDPRHIILVRVAIECALSDQETEKFDLAEQTGVYVTMFADELKGAADIVAGKV